MPDAIPTRRREYLVAAAVCLAIVLVMVWRTWSPIERRQFGIDTQWEYWGELQYQFDAYRHGELPLWNPYCRGGYPFYQDAQNVVLYPVTWLLLGLAAVGRGVGFWIMTVTHIFHLWLLVFGMYVYLRRRGLPPAACYAGGLVLLLSSPIIHHIDLNMNWSTAWVPWVLIALERWDERPTSARAALLAAALAICFLAGATPNFWYGMLVAFPYGVYLVARRILQLRKDDPAAVAAHLRQVAASGAVCVGLFSMLVVAQFHATTKLLPDTVRATRDLGFVTGTQFGADDLVGFFVPRMTRLNQYIGVLGIVGVAAAMSLSRPDGRKLLLAALAVAGALCAWGMDGVVLPLLASALKPFQLFRYAMRYTYVSIVPLAILAAEGIAALAGVEGAEAQRQARRFVLVGCGLAAAIAAVGFIVKEKPADRLPYGMAFAAYAVSAWVAAMLVGSAESGRRIFLAVAACALGLDLLVAHGDAIERNMGKPVNTRRDAEIAGLDGVQSRAYRIYDRAYLRFQPGIRQRVRDFGGYEGHPLALSRYAALRDALSGNPSGLGHMNVRWLLEGDKPMPAGGRGGVKQVRPGVSEVRDVAPIVLWVDRAQVVEPQAAVGTLLATRAGTAAVLERPTLTADEIARAETGDAATSPVAGTVVEQRRNSFVAEIDAPADGVVVIHEAYAPGWTARVDGQPAKIVPANGMFRGLLVGPGHHRIELSYHARAFLALFVVQLLGMAGVGTLLWRDRRK